MTETVTKAPKLTPRQRKAIAAILETSSITEAAKVAGVTPKTIHKWRRDDPEFSKALDKAQGEALGAAACKLIAQLTGALDRLEALAKDETTPASVQLRANLAIIEQAVKYYAVQTIEPRLVELENKMDERIAQMQGKRR